MAAVYCTRCGCENADTRGACLRCFNPLDWPTGDVTCSSCGAELPGDADYCRACGAAVTDVPPAPDCSLAAAISLVLGGAADIGPAEEEYEEEELIGPADVPAVDFEEAEEVAPAAEAAEEVTAAPPPPPPPPPAEEIAFEEVAAEEEPAAAEEEAAEELFEPSSASEEISFAPPPPPPPPEEVGTDGMLDQEVPAFEPPADKEEEPSFAPPAEETPAAEDDKEKDEEEDKKDDLGGWVIDFDEE